MDVPLAYILDSRATGKAGTALTKVEETERGENAGSIGQEFRYGFQVGGHDRGLALVLDPARLSCCGYIGGSGDDYGTGIAVDNSGHVYLTGHTQSTQTGFPVTVGPDLTHNGGYDVFVAKVFEEPQFKLPAWGKDQKDGRL